MHKRESILSSLRGRSTKDKEQREHSPGTEPLGLSPQASSASARSLSSLVPKKTPEDEPVSFRIMLETPPAVMYGPPRESSGALISGICDVDLTRSGGPTGVVDLLEVSMSIVQEIHMRLPPHIAKKVGTAQKQRNVLATWDILQHPHILASATFAYPFSHLLPGTLPPTSRTNLFTVEYFIEATATTKNHKRSEARQPLKIGRSVSHPTEKTSVRIFPPTSLTLSMVLPTALFPNGQVSAEMRMEGLVSPTPTTVAGAQRYRRWQLKRINWRVDESVKVKWGESADEEYEFKQTLGFGQHRSGWKTDFSLGNGCVEYENPDFCPGVLGRASKDLQDPVLGLSVSHQLICELLTAEELLSTPQAKQGMLSGSARVLRMQFAFPVVDRPGLGIPWIDEVPPMYADVPLSPPQYSDVANLPVFEEFRTNALVFSPLLAPVMSPTLRHFDPTMRGFEHRPPGSLTPGSLTPTAATPLPSAFPSALPSAQPSASPSAAPSATHSPALHPSASPGGSVTDLVALASLDEPAAPPKLRHRQS